ncbi:hypothetical protein GCM10009634_34480 [Saccharothrix xinjiangensis]
MLPATGLADAHRHVDSGHNRGMDAGLLVAVIATVLVLLTLVVLVARDRFSPGHPDDEPGPETSGGGGGG